MIVTEHKRPEPLATRAKMKSKRFTLLAVCALLVGGCTEEVEVVEMGEGPHAGLHGGWVVSEAEGLGIAAEHGLFIFSESGHYSQMWVPSWDRALLPENQEDVTEAQMAEAYMGFVANSGRYVVEGNSIMYEAYMARDPQYMARFEPMGGEGNARTMNYQLNDDGTLTLEWVADDWFTTESRMVLRRPGAASQD